MKAELRKQLLEQLPPEFTAQEAKRLLRENYDAPGKLLEGLVHRKELIRLKRGLYVLPENYEPLTAAGSIGQPSYVSFETALAFYGMIPEWVFTIYSVIDGRAFEHTVQNTKYVYRSQRRDLYALGMSSIRLRDRNVLFASPEKALLDSLAAKKLQTASATPGEIYQFVQDDMRIESESLERLKITRLQSMMPLYRNRAPGLFTEALYTIQEGSDE